MNYIAKNAAAWNVICDIMGYKKESYQYKAERVISPKTVEELKSKGLLEMLTTKVELQ